MPDSSLLPLPDVSGVGYPGPSICRVPLTRGPHGGCQSFPSLGKGLHNLGLASSLPLPIADREDRMPPTPVNSPPPTLCPGSLQAERLAKQQECPAWVPARLPRPRTLFSPHRSRGLYPQRPPVPWLILVPHPIPRAQTGHSQQRRPSILKQPMGWQAAPGGLSLPLASLQPLPQAGPRTMASDSGVCLDRDNELGLHFLREL